MTSHTLECLNVVADWVNKMQQMITHLIDPMILQSDKDAIIDDFKKTIEKMNLLLRGINIPLKIKHENVEFTSTNNRRVPVSGKHIIINAAKHFDKLDELDYDDYNNNNLIIFYLILLDSLYIKHYVNKQGYLVYEAYNVTEEDVVSFTFSRDNNNNAYFSRDTF
tara:strand:- start:108 stop:602 length:495 start_codon:yes stop_codon:yes gene_type:complete